MKIEIVQRWAARWVLGDYSPYSSVSDMLDKLGWRTLEQRRSDSRLVLFYKILHCYVAVPVPSYVISGPLLQDPSLLCCSPSPILCYLWSSFTRSFIAMLQSQSHPMLSLVLFYKILHYYVAVPVPSYVISGPLLQDPSLLCCSPSPILCYLWSSFTRSFIAMLQSQSHPMLSLVLFYKILHCYVAVPVPSYVISLTRISRTSHPLAYRQIFSRTDYRNDPKFSDRYSWAV